MDNVLVDFTSAFSKIDPKLLKMFEGRLDEVPNIFSVMDPIEGAIDNCSTSISGNRRDLS